MKAAALRARLECESSGRDFSEKGNVVTIGKCKPVSRNFLSMANAAHAGSGARNFGALAHAERTCLSERVT